jgi:hypothetical protein
MHLFSISSNQKISQIGNTSLYNESGIRKLKSGRLITKLMPQL